MSWGNYVRRLISGESQRAAETRTGISQGTISRWLRDEGTPEPAQAARLAQAYGGNVLEAFMAAGFLTEEQAGLPPRADVSFVEVVDVDPHLSAEAKAHIKNQYGLLKAASVANRAELLREEIVNNTGVSDETRRQLLAMIDGDQAQVEVALSVQDAGDGLTPVELGSLERQRQARSKATSTTVPKAARRTTRRGSKAKTPAQDADAQD